MVICAPFKRDLEFPTQILVVFVAYQKAKQRLRIREDIECLRCRRARTIACGNVAYSVATSFARGDASVSQKPQEVGNFFQPDVVNLCVLARGEMQEPAAEPVCRISQAHELIGAQDSTRNLDSLHLHSLLALSVSAEVQT
jgi:hypothetical protein